MKHQRTIVLAGLLTAAVGAAVAGVAAERGGRDQDRAPAAQAERDDRGRRGRDMVFIGPEGGGRRAIRLDGRGSQIGVVVSDLEGRDAPGVRIDGVDEAGAAAKAGLKEGDVVVEFDGERVRSARQLTRLVQETVDGRTVGMTVTRDGVRRTLDVTPEASSTAWNVVVNEPEIRAGIERGLRELPGLTGPLFNFGFDGVPGARGRLGVRAETLSDQLADYFGATGGGVLVSSVTAGSPAQKAGVRAGDVITKVNGRDVRDAGALVQELRDVRDGGDVRLDVVRDRSPVSITVVLERPSAPRPSRRPA